MNKTFYENFPVFLAQILDDTVNKEPKEFKIMTTKQERYLEAVRSNQYIVGSIDAEGNTSFSKNPITHTDPHSARAECSRLAKTNPGKAFVFCRFLGGSMLPAEPQVHSF